MRFNENRPIAWAVLAVCVIGSVVGLGGGSMAKDRAALVRQFNSGVNTESTSRTGMDAYLDRAAEQAKIMANEALMLLGDDSSAQEMLSVAQTVSDSDDYDARYTAYVTLQNDSDQLYNQIYEKFDKETTKNFKRAYDDFWEADKFVKRDPYRQQAADFNSELIGFPANVITSLRGVTELNTFGAD